MPNPKRRKVNKKNEENNLVVSEKKKHSKLIDMNELSTSLNGQDYMDVPTKRKARKKNKNGNNIIKSKNLIVQEDSDTEDSFENPKIQKSKTKKKI